MKVCLGDERGTDATVAKEEPEKTGRLVYETLVLNKTVSRTWLPKVDRVADLFHVCPEAGILG